ncbi:MAG TPA: hypothetical protein VIU64_00680 [Polyangia bacterium]
MSTLSKLVAPVLASVVLFGCGGGSSKPNGAGGAGGSASGTFNPANLACTGSSQMSNCTAAELEPFQTCITTNCAAGLQTCYGAGYASGQLSGPCGTYAGCVGKCSCNDTTCRAACGTQPTECTTCMGSSLTTCAFSCLGQLPACATGGGLGGASGGLGGSFGGLGGSFGGLGGASGATSCLAQLATCCLAATPATLQAECAADAQDLVSMGTVAETACGVKLANLKTKYCP